MPPGTRRANRSGYVEHDDFEGLPVRQWRQEWTSVAPPAPSELQLQNDVWAIELLHGMPKDAALLPPHTQELLRAARSGRLYKRPAPTEDDEGDGDAVQPEKLDKKEDDVMAQGYQLRVWKQLPKNVEAPGISHLARRRKNVVTIASRTVEERVQGPTVTRATVRRIDAAGNPYTEEVTLTEGQQPDGEVISTRVEALTTTKAEALAPVPVAPKRRPPPPKRKAKPGPGRGKKKMKNMPAGEEGQSAVMTLSETVAIKPEDDKSVNLSQMQAHVPSHPGEVASHDDDEDDTDDGDDADDADEGDDEGDEVGESEQHTLTMDAAATMSKSPDDGSAGHFAPASQAPEPADVEMDDDVMVEDPPVPSQPTHPATDSTFPPEGSLLKEVVVPSPAGLPVPLPQSVTADEAPSLASPTHLSVDGPHAAAIGMEPPHEEAPAQEPVTAGPGAHEALVAPVDEALLPPPPDQVGNISSPRTDDGAKSQAGRELEESDATRQTLLSHQMSTTTEDTIKPEDSVSVTAPVCGSTAVSEVGTASVDGAREVPLGAMEEAPLKTEDALQPAESVPAPEKGEAAGSPAEEDFDLLEGLMGELNRQEGEAELQPSTSEAVTQNEVATAPLAEADMQESAAVDAESTVVSRPAPEQEQEQEMVEEEITVVEAMETALAQEEGQGQGQQEEGQNEPTNT